MADTGVGVLEFVHDCRCHGCGHREKHGDDAVRLCPSRPHHLRHGKVRQVTFHDLPRIHGSLLADAGVATSVAAKLLRHSDPRLTQSLYTQADLTMVRGEVNRLRLPSGRPHSAQAGRPTHPSRSVLCRLASRTQQNSRGCDESPRSELNRRPTVYETVALPLSYRGTPKSIRAPIPVAEVSQGGKAEPEEILPLVRSFHLLTRPQNHGSGLELGPRGPV